MKTMNKLSAAFSIGGLLMALMGSAQAITIGPTGSTNRWLGSVNPGSPANTGDEVGIINFLLGGDGTFTGYNGGATAGTPYTAGSRTFTLRNDNNPTDLIPDPAPLAIELGAIKDDDDGVLDNGLDNPFTLGGSVSIAGNNVQLAGSYDWLLLKYGNQSEVFYIGDLSLGTVITMDASGAGGGLSHWSLYNASTNVSDGGATVALFGCTLLGLAGLRRALVLRRA